MQNVLVRPQTAVIQPIGSLNSGNIITFQHQLTTAISSEHHSSLLVDMAQVESIDSAGLMALVSALSLSQSLNKRFSLCAVSRPVQIILELTQLDRAFEILEGCHSLNEAAA